MNFDACFFSKNNSFFVCIFFIFTVWPYFKGIQRVFTKVKLLINMFIFFIGKD